MPETEGDYKPEENLRSATLVDKFTRCLGIVTRTSALKDFRSILYFSHGLLLHSPTSTRYWKEKNRVRCLSKLGDYEQIIKHMPIILGKASKAKITVEQVLT